MDIESQKDLAISEEDAENVLGGKKKAKAKQRPASPASAPRMISVRVTPTTVSSDPPADDCEDPGTQVVDSGE